MLNTIKTLHAMGAKDVAGQVTRKTRMRRARKDAQDTIDKFTENNAVAISQVKDFYTVSLQHALSLHMDVERQRFVARHRKQLEEHYITNLWFNLAERHPGAFWILCDLERERDLHEGRWHIWRKHIYVTPEAVTGEQMSLIENYDESEGIA